MSVNYLFLAFSALTNYWALANRLEISFSGLRYDDTAPKVGLEPVRLGHGIPTFDMQRARLPDDLFRDIIQGLRMAAHQYGTPYQHRNEGVRSRYISAVRACRPSNIHLTNTSIVPEPNVESILRGASECTRSASRQPIHYTIAEGITTALFIKVKH